MKITIAYSVDIPGPRSHSFSLELGPPSRSELDFATVKERVRAAFDPLTSALDSLYSAQVHIQSAKVTFDLL